MVNWLERAKTTFRRTPDRATAVTDDRTLVAAPEPDPARPRVGPRASELSRSDDALERPWTGRSPTATPLVCYACHERRFWLSIHGVMVCGLCHPPGSPDLVAEWIEDGDA